MGEDVIRLEHGVGFEFAAPIAIGMLLIKQIVTRPRNRRRNLRQSGVDSPEAGSCRFGLR